MTAAGAVLGEALLALLGVMLSDPRVTWPAITNVLPAAVAYDVLLCPFVLYAVAAALRLAGVRDEARRPGLSPSQARTPVSAASQGAVRQLAGGSAPRLRLSERDKGTGSIGGLRGTGSVRPAARREPQLKLGRAGQRTVVGMGAAFAPAAFGAGTARVKFGGRRREGVLGGSLLGGSRPGRRSAGGATRLGSAGLGIPRFGSSSMGRSLLGGSVFSRRRLPVAAALRPVRAARPVVTAPAPGQPGGRRAGRASAAVLPWPLARPALHRATPVGRAEVPGPGLAARRVLASRLTGRKYAGRRVDATPRLRRPPDRP